MADSDLLALATDGFLSDGPLDDALLCIATDGFLCEPAPQGIGGIGSGSGRKWKLPAIVARAMYSGWEQATEVCAESQNIAAVMAVALDESDEATRLAMMFGLHQNDWEDDDV